MCLGHLEVRLPFLVFWRGLTYDHWAVLLNRNCRVASISLVPCLAEVSCYMFFLAVATFMISIETPDRL